MDLSQAFLEAGYARSPVENFTWGASLVGVMQVFAARGVGTFGGWTESAALGQAPTSLSNNGHDQSFGLGAKFGIQWEVTDTVAFAGAYQMKIHMGKLNDYSDLFPGQGNMDIPANLKLGLTFRPKSSFALSFDYEKIWYSLSLIHI